MVKEIAEQTQKKRMMRTVQTGDFNDSETTQTGNGNDDITNQTIDYNMSWIQTGDKNEAITRQNGDFVCLILLKRVIKLRES
jgi:hypothetical protein